MEIKNIVKQAIANGDKVKVDLEHKSLWIAHRLVIENGFPCDGYELNYPRKETMVALEELKHLYTLYRYSVPSERSERKRHKNYFYALPLSKLNDNDFIRAIVREEARITLETELLFNSVVGNLVWQESFGNWFYRNGDFIVKKSWF